MGNLTQKGKCIPWKGQWHWQTTKSVYIYTFVFTGTYTGPFCHNPVESKPIPTGICGASKSTEQQGLRKKDDEYITSYNIFQAHIIVSYDSSHLHGSQDWLSSSQKYTSTGMKNMAGTSANIESESLQESYRNMWGTNNQLGVIWLQTLVMIQ